MPKYSERRGRKNYGPITEAMKHEYWKLRSIGVNQDAASKQVGVSHVKGRGWDREWEDEGQRPFQTRTIKGPIPHDQLKKDARRALEDFDYFQYRYFGRIPVGWQRESAQLVAELEATDQDEYVCINVAPGSGKSSTMIAIVCWMICRNRRIRVLWGSYSQNQAEWYVNQIRAILATTVAMKADPKELQKGTAVDAQATIAEDFGRMKPEETDIWRKDQFYVEQEPGYHRVNKEATVQAFGMDTAFIGGRFDLVIWDDVYDAAKLRNWEMKQRQRDWWVSTAETRLDPGGLLVLQMQRLDAEDISHFVLEMTEGEWDDESDLYDDGPTVKEKGGDLTKKYRHIVYPAHFEDRCRGPEFHRRGSPSYPEGCLLYEKNIPWRKLRAQKANNPHFRMLYQQEDMDPVNVLVDPLWISGGMGREGIEHPGCWDKERGVGELPKGVNTFDCLSMVSVDPSPSNYWAVQWWLYHGPSQHFFLLDLMKERMTAPKFLDWEFAANKFSGVMADWFERSVQLGAQITHLVVEINAAQKFMLQYDHMQRFLRANGVALIPHTTNQNKQDKETGVTILQPEFMFGRVRLPGAWDRGRQKSMWLYDEVTRWQLDKPDGGIATTDQVMAAWFARLSVQKIYRPKNAATRLARPSWVRANRPVFGVVA